MKKVYYTWGLGFESPLETVLKDICAKELSNYRNYNYEYLKHYVKIPPLYNKKIVGINKQLSEIAKKHQVSYRLAENIANNIWLQSGEITNYKTIIWGATTLVSEVGQLVLSYKQEEYLMGENWITQDEILLNGHDLMMGPEINICKLGSGINKNTEKYIQKLKRRRYSLEKLRRNYVLYSPTMSEWPEVANQFDSMLVDIIIQVPANITLVIKLHPRDIEKRYKKYKRIIEAHQNNNIRIARKSERLEELIYNCKYVITHKSKTIFDALIAGKKIVHIGPSNIKGSRLISEMNNEFDWNNKSLMQFTERDRIERNILFTYILKNFVTPVTKKAILKKIKNNSVENKKTSLAVVKYYDLQYRYIEDSVKHDRRVRSLKHNNQRLHTMYNGILESTSWRITAPMRKIISVIRNEKKS